MSLEAQSSHSSSRSRDAVPHPSREEYQKAAADDLADQIKAIELAVSSNAPGRDAQEYLLGWAHDRTDELESKKLLTEEQVTGFRSRIAALDAGFYEEAA